MMVAMMTVCDPGDRVGLFSPFYENYAADALLAGAEPVHVPLHPPDYRFDPAELRRVFAGGLKAFVLCNPSNPCGRVFTREELGQLAALAEEFDVWVLTDEVYEHIVFPPHRHTYFSTLPGMAERTLMCSSLSKTFAITGWRLGYVQAAPAVIAQARKVHDFLTVGAAAPLQHAVVTALRFPESYYAGLAAEYAVGRDILLGYLERTGLAFSRPEGAYFVMVDISPFGHASDVEFAHWMTREVEFLRDPGAPLRAPQFRQAPRDPARGGRAAAAAAALKRACLNARRGRPSACSRGRDSRSASLVGPRKPRRRPRGRTRNGSQSATARRRSCRSWWAGGPR
jgi:aminotransferase